jgi:hypothetical protein
VHVVKSVDERLTTLRTIGMEKRDKESEVALSLPDPDLGISELTKLAGDLLIP